MYIFVKLIILSFFLNSINALTQKITVYGKLLCDKAPLKNINIKLMEEDILYDEMISEGVTDSQGNFNVSGEHVEYTTIEPYIEINYKCPEYEAESVEDRKFLYVPRSVFRYLGYTRKFQFNFDEIDLIKIKKRAHWYFF